MKRKKKKSIDWKGIEKDYRAGKTSNRQIAEWYGVSEGAIRKRAKAHNWSQMARQDIQAEAVRPVEYIPPVKTAEDAKTIAKDGKSLAKRMLSELLATTTNVGELEDLIISECAGDRDGRRRTAMLRAVDLPARAMTLKTLGQAMESFLKAERGQGKPGEPLPPSGATDAHEEQSADDWDRLLN